MDKSIEILYNEHDIIKSVINYREKIVSLSKTNPELFKKIIFELIGFFRNYADKFHHYKEEKLLFPLMCEKNDMLKDSIVGEMLENHQDFRNLIGKIELAANSQNYEEAGKVLFTYTEMLLDHIAVEDDEVFQMAETLLDEDELDKLYFDFQDIDRELGYEIKRGFEKIEDQLALQV